MKSFQKKSKLERSLHFGTILFSTIAECILSWQVSLTNCVLRTELVILGTNDITKKI